MPQYPVTEILAKQDEIRAKAKERLGANLQGYGIYISDISFSPDFQTAIGRSTTEVRVPSAKLTCLKS